MMRENNFDLDATNTEQAEMQQEKEVTRSVELAIAVQREKALAQVIDKIRRTLDLEIIFQTTVREVRQLLAADRVAVFRFDPESGLTRGEFVSEDVLPEFSPAFNAQVVDHCFAEDYAEAYRQGRILAVEDVEQANLFPCHREILARFQVRANLVVPLLKGEALWGLLCIHQCARSRKWEESEIEFIRKIALHLGVALQQAELLDNAQRQTAELQIALAEVQAQKEQQARATEQERALSQVIDKIRRTLDLDTIFKTTATEVRQLLNADRVAVFRFEPDSGFTLGEFVSEDVLPEFNSALAAQVEDHCFGENHAVYYQQGRIFSLEDVGNTPLLDCHRQILASFQVRANLVAPLLKGEQLWGLLCIHQCAAPRQWQEEEREFVKKIALNLGVALQQAELLAQMQRRTEELQVALDQVQKQKEDLSRVAAQEKALARVIERIRQTLELDNIFEATTAEVRHILKCDRVVVYRFYKDWSGEFLYESLAQGWQPLTWTDGVKMVWEDTYLKDTKGGRYREHGTLAVNDVQEAKLTPCHLKIEKEKAAGQYREQFQIKAFVVVPVFVGDTLWGLLGAYQHSNPRSWQPREVSLITQVANQLGVGVYQAQLLTQTKAQSQILRSTLADLNAIVDNLADGLLVVDILGHITRFNPALLSMFNLTNVDLTGKHLSEVFSLQLATLVEQSELETQGVVTAEVNLGEGREGQALATSIIKESEGEEGEQCLGSVILIRDVTAEREVDRMKTEFLATVSHELRTPLTSILGFASLIQEKLEEVIFPIVQTNEIKVQKALKKVGQNINIIVSEAERLTALINDVLDIAKMEAGRMEWNIQATSPLQILERAIDATYPLFQHKNLRLVKDFDHNLPQVYVDEDRLIQVVINLLSNAVKFTEQGMVTCCVKLANDNVVISITDTGYGIPQEDQQKIFSPFEQGGNILTNKPQGTGLGLPICRQIVEYHGGKIWVQSQLERGSTFAFTIPLNSPKQHIHQEVQLVNRLFRRS